MSEQRLVGTAGAPGVAIGPVWRYSEATASIASTGAGSPGSATSGSGGAASGGAVGVDPAARIADAADATAAQLEALAGRMRDLGREEEAGIFEAQALMATDPTLLDDAVAKAAGGMPPDRAVREAAGAAAEMLAMLDDELLAARAADVRDVGARIARTLRGEALRLPEVPAIAVADDLPPSVTAEIPPGFLLGIALSGGSPTAHAVILSRGLGIPAIVAVDGLLEAVDERLAAADDRLAAEPSPLEAIIDGEAGSVVLEPSEVRRSEATAQQVILERRRVAAAALRGRPGATADGERVMLVANIGSPDDAPRAIEAGAEGVGLFRTEFLFMSRPAPPSEAEQVEAYRRVLAAFGPDRPVVIRLADIGGDKAIPYLALPAEANPFLGVRAIRLAYRDRALLLTQLRAIWQAGALAGVVPHVMAPMVATLADVDLLVSLRAEAEASVRTDGLPCAERMVTGIMVEVPSAAFMAPELARRVDFFSIGTNDLTQYTLAADRGNAGLVRLQDALDPAVLRAIRGIVAGADGAGIPVAVCGELAGDPAGALVLVGLGVDELSADAGSLDGVRAALAGVTRRALDELATAVLAAPDAATVRGLVAALLTATGPDPD
jgi:phosphoenolpyruvate-protein phosphotransferase